MTEEKTNGQVERVARPLVWARKDQLQHASTRGGLMCAMYPNTDRRADLQPLYDQAALDAAVAAERERCAKLEREIRYLRHYGNKDCPHMADVAIKRGDLEA